MKKVAILTINDYSNYGNRLQNYATQEVLKSLGFSVETLVNTNGINNDKEIETKSNNKRSKLQKLKNMSIKGIVLKIAFRFWKIFNKNKIDRYGEKRLQTFKLFTKDFIQETKFSISDDNISKELLDQYDFFITGSDQVWNPYFRYGSSIDFLTFAPKNKRVAYAPSFGITDIPSQYVGNYQVWLSEMSSLSIREKAGKEIIKKLTGRESEVLVDPTLMLTKEKWLSIAKPSPNKPTKNYILTYFFGGVSEEIRNRIKKISKENNLEIVNLADITDLETFIAGPSEFLDYINSASLFCTNSFHGCVFSILMQIPFIAFQREGNIPSMNSRIETLLSTFNLQSRFSTNVLTNEQVFAKDYSHIDLIIESEREKAINYLKRAMLLDSKINSTMINA
ncbi:polysaccharide pyruvyl transferase family protein [Niallia sp. FSL K6-0077]